MAFTSHRWADVGKNAGVVNDDGQPLYDNINIEIEILLPDGLYLTIHAGRDDSIKKLMHSIWVEAKKKFGFIFTKGFTSEPDFCTNWALSKLGYPTPVPIDEKNTQTVAEIDAFMDIYKLEQRSDARMKLPEFPMELFGEEFIKQFHLDIGEEGQDFVEAGKRKKEIYDESNKDAGCFLNPPLPKRPSQNSRTLRSPAEQGRDNVHFTFSIIDVIIPHYSHLGENRSELQITVDIFHGYSNLNCQQKKITVQLEKDRNGQCIVKRRVVHGFIQPVTLEINEGDIPRNAKLTFTVSFGQRKNESSIKYWVNLPVYDHNRKMVNQLIKLPMWEWNFNSSVNFQPQFATNIANPDKRTTPILHVAFQSDGVKKYPTTREMIADYRDTNPPLPPIKTDLIRVLMKDQLEEIDENDKEGGREAAVDLMTRVPDTLPRILSCFQWEKREHVAKIRYLLSEWPPVSKRTCIELLDCSYPDYQVRSFAVHQLRQLKISDDELNAYMLQLVQALQFEPNLNNDLVWFMLERSVTSQVVWHRLFWLLKSEMHRPSVAVRFGLIIQCYFKFRSDQVNEYRDEIKMCLTLCEISTELMKSDECSLKEMLKVAQLDKKLQPKHLPITRKWKLKQLRQEKCRVMTSKKRPLKLHWKTESDKAAIVFFKQGDDLKQDMLALQLLEIMDHFWQKAKFDCKVETYGCITVGDQQGFIEAVQDSETLADIQGKVKRGVWKDETLLDYLKKHNPDESLEPALKRFHETCAKYCVATYILGVGDRHNDNLMLKENGQFFHIDFGHILGDFKKKYIFQYERSLFVFHAQFLQIILAGSEGDANRKRFHDECVSLYKIIREQGAFFVSLLLIMLYAGAPNLQTRDDIDYIRTRLMLNRSWEEAETNFRKDLTAYATKQTLSHVKWLAHSQKQRHIKKKTEQDNGKLRV